ncbi:MAG: hypothetical protein KBD78_06900 [Oligoflexales bacterium]|nr:hypothetical protein [Oligoflexales bacterium]
MNLNIFKLSFIIVFSLFSCKSAESRKSKAKTNIEVSATLGDEDWDKLFRWIGALDQQQVISLGRGNLKSNPQLSGEIKETGFIYEDPAKAAVEGENFINRKFREYHENIKRSLGEEFKSEFIGAMHLLGIKLIFLPQRENLNTLPIRLSRVEVDPGANLDLKTFAANISGKENEVGSYTDVELDFPKISAKYVINWNREYFRSSAKVNPGFIVRSADDDVNGLLLPHDQELEIVINDIDYKSSLKSLKFNMSIGFEAIFKILTKIPQVAELISKITNIGGSIGVDFDKTFAIEESKSLENYNMLNYGPVATEIAWQMLDVCKAILITHIHNLGEQESTCRNKYLEWFGPGSRASEDAINGFFPPNKAYLDWLSFKSSDVRNPWALYYSKDDSKWLDIEHAIAKETVFESEFAAYPCLCRPSSLHSIRDEGTFLTKDRSSSISAFSNQTFEVQSCRHTVKEEFGRAEVKVVAPRAFLGWESAKESTFSFYSKFNDGNANTWERKTKKILFEERWKTSLISELDLSFCPETYNLLQHYRSQANLLKSAGSSEAYEVIISELADFESKFKCYAFDVHHSFTDVYHERDLVCGNFTPKPGNDAEFYMLENYSGEPIKKIRVSPQASIAFSEEKYLNYKNATESNENLGQIDMTTEKLVNKLNSIIAANKLEVVVK